MKGFRKFEKKFQLGALVKSAAFGVSCGVLSFSIVWLVCKLCAVALSPVWYAAIGVAVAAACFGVSYALLRPTEKKVAKKLDGALSLPEKTQTMIEFQNSEDDMARLQRADADARLRATPLKAVKTGKLWKNLLLPALALVMLVTAAIVPMKVVEPVGEEDPKYTFTAYDKTRLEELIETVKASDMEVEPKLLIVTDLEELLDILQTVEYQREMKSAVVEVIANTARLERTVNTYDELSAALTASDNEQVQSLGKAIGTVNVEKLSDEWNTRRDELIGENAVNVEPYEKALRQAMNKMSVTRENDPLHESLKAFVDEVKVVYTTKTTTDADWQTAMDAAFHIVSQASDLALLQQYDNKETADMVVAELMDIFGITSKDLPSDVLSGSVTDKEGDYDDPTEDKELSGGGGPDFEIVYGSNDTIYYPNDEKYVSYNEVWQEFRDKAYELADGEDVPEDLAAFIRDYFTSLK